MSTDDLFAGGGETGRLMACLDWSGTPLGPIDGWSQSLRAAVRIVLSSRYPMLLLWGPEFSQLYNDAYSALIGDQHPAALGGDVRVTLEAGWDVLQPLIAEAMATGVASWVPALQLLLERAGYREEAYFSVSHAPARDDVGATVGVLAVCSEVTEQVVGERRLRLLRDLPLQTAGVPQTCERLAEAIGEHPLDVPFAAIYLRDGGVLRRAARTGDADLPDTWDLDGASRLDVSGTLAVPGGPWGDPVREAVVVPLPSADQDQPLGVLVAGVSPSRALDDGYRSFFHLLAQQVALAVRNSMAYEEERRRAEALAELDRVKTAFFTNVSHEFRTPLTLMLGPLADALAGPLADDQRERVETAWRNATRLLTLVNNLMTFSSLEAGSAGNEPREVDLARLTADLAGVFRSAVERASVRLVVDCPPLPRSTAVDPGNWETIVTNLLSNALKFTFVGEIRVTLDSDDDQVRLRVTDTGIGIPGAELPHLFDRFHRVPGARSRSHEGSGIGLALVRELTRLLGGDVTVVSTPGRGTTFVVALPWSALTSTTGPPTATSGDRAHALAQEALGWLDDPAPPDPGAATGVRILIADDNSDMRAYLARLLRAQHWQVETVRDGRAALDAIRRRPPSLLLTDVMMPGLDGFSLVRALRREQGSRTLPVVMLSARAGGAAGVEGLDAGADDYIVKPFTAAELIARIRGTLHLADLRTAQPDHPPTTTSPPTHTQPAPAQPAPAQQVPDQPVADQPAPDQPAPDQLVPGQPAVDQLDSGTPGSKAALAQSGPAPVADPAPFALADTERDWTYPLAPTASAAMRRDLRSALSGRIDPDLLDDLQVAATEAVNNAVEHAQQPTRPDVDVRLRVVDGLIRIGVRDYGTWRGRPAPMDRGRGALLMNAYGDVTVSPTPAGTEVTIERRLQ
ncbi:ATP-binding protein [Micromonosporaceae bacterium Da 78-11]